VKVLESQEGIPNEWLTRSTKALRQLFVELELAAKGADQELGPVK
jgi:hypothetical protein